MTSSNRRHGRLSSDQMSGGPGCLQAVDLGMPPTTIVGIDGLALALLGDAARETPTFEPVLFRKGVGAP